MIKTTSVYYDRKTGGIRMYISRDIENKLKWIDHQPVILTIKNGKLVITKDIEEVPA